MGTGHNRCRTAIAKQSSQVKDEDPYDYALVERLFPKSTKFTVRFRLRAEEISPGHALEIEVQDQRGGRPMCLRLDRDYLGVDRKAISFNPLPVQVKTWYEVKLAFDCQAQKYHLTVDGRQEIRDIPFAEEIESLERIVFRSGPFRGYVPPEHVDDAMPKPAGLETEDLPGADETVSACVYWIDDLITSSD